MRTSSACCSAAALRRATRAPSYVPPITAISQLDPRLAGPSQRRRSSTGLRARLRSPPRRGRAGLDNPGISLTDRRNESAAACTYSPARPDRAAPRGATRRRGRLRGGTGRACSSPAKVVVARARRQRRPEGVEGRDASRATRDGARTAAVAPAAPFTRVNAEPHEMTEFRALGILVLESEAPREGTMLGGGTLRVPPPRRLCPATRRAGAAPGATSPRGATPPAPPPSHHPRSRRRPSR